MHQKYTIVFSSNTNLVFIFALKTAGFSISFSSIFKIIFHNFGVRNVILYLLFVSLKEGTIQLFLEKRVGYCCEGLKVVVQPQENNAYKAFLILPNNFKLQLFSFEVEKLKKKLKKKLRPNFGPRDQKIVKTSAVNNSTCRRAFALKF